MRPGTIQKIYVKNFVTYSEVEVSPGVNLNILIGPNGTGKSTILAAIILGLGGTPKTIGRGTKISEYVKHGCDESRIDIYLYGEQPTSIYKVSRLFNINNQSNWYINNKGVSEVELKKLSVKLNIQVNNLCQFLPQDRVQDFAKMNKKELLLNTQKSIGRQDLVDNHTELVNARKEEKVLSKDMEDVVGILEQTEAEVNRLEGKVQNLKEKKKYISEINVIKRKIYWIKYAELLNTQEGIDKDKKQAEKLLNKHKKKIQPTEHKISNLRNENKKLQDNVVQIRNSIDRLKTQIDMYLEKITDLRHERQLKKHEMNTELESLKVRAREMDEMKAKVDKLVNDEQSLVAQFGNEGSIERKAMELLHNSNEFKNKLGKLQQANYQAKKLYGMKSEELKVLESKEKQIADIKLKRLEIIKRRNPDTYNAILWLKDNRHMFKGEVYDPMLLEINVINPAHTKYMENIIPMRDRIAFTCVLREDMNLLLRIMRDEKKLKINAVHSGEDHPALASYRPGIPIEYLTKYGFCAYMNSLITGPEAILKYCCRMYSLHNIPVGNDLTYRMASQVPEQIRLFFSESHRFAVNVSRYTGAKSTKISEAIGDGTFSACVDLKALNTIKKSKMEINERLEKLQRSLEDNEEQQNALENQRSELLVQRRNILQSKEQFQVIRERLTAARKQLHQFMQSSQSEEEIRKKAMQAICSNLMKSKRFHESIVSTLKQLDDYHINEESLMQKLSNMNDEIDELENELEKLRYDCVEVQRTYDQIETHYSLAVRETNDALREAKKLSDGFHINDHGFDKFRARHESLPSDIDELNSLMDEIQTKIECILTADESEIRKYESAVKQAETLRSNLSDKERTLAELSKKVQTLHKKWIEPLEDLVSRINKNFSDYFESLGCAGEVQISKEAGETEYSEYGLSIRVTYRVEDPLQELNQFLQSGGERAVATAIFLISLQELSAAPFRCVDEINQGMDPQNEKRIFDILVEATTKVDTCQYFLITPKLISSLKFSEGMKISIVLNGPQCNIGKTWSIQSIIDSRNRSKS